MIFGMDYQDFWLTVFVVMGIGGFFCFVSLMVLLIGIKNALEGIEYALRSVMFQARGHNGGR